MTTSSKSLATQMKNMATAQDDATREDLQEQLMTVLGRLLSQHDSGTVSNEQITGITQLLSSNNPFALMAASGINLDGQRLIDAIMDSNFDTKVKKYISRGLFPDQPGGLEINDDGLPVQIAALQKELTEAQDKQSTDTSGTTSTDSTDSSDPKGTDDNAKKVKEAGEVFGKLSSIERNWNTRKTTRRLSAVPPKGSVVLTPADLEEIQGLVQDLRKALGIAPRGNSRS